MPLTALLTTALPTTALPTTALLTTALPTTALPTTALAQVTVEPTVVTDQLAVAFYGGYAVLAVALVVWLARTLQRNGEIFLENVFEDEGMAGAINRLLVVGFYLLNLGYALLLYKVSEATALTEAFNGLVERVGLLVLSLGVIHLVNMGIFWRIRTHKDRQPTTPPAPTYLTAPAAPMPPAPMAR